MYHLLGRFSGDVHTDLFFFFAAKPPEVLRVVIVKHGGGVAFFHGYGAILLFLTNASWVSGRVC